MLYANIYYYVLYIRGELSLIHLDTCLYSPLWFKLGLYTENILKNTLSTKHTYVFS